MNFMPWQIKQGPLVLLALCSFLREARVHTACKEQ